MRLLPILAYCGLMSQPAHIEQYIALILRIVDDLLADHTEPLPT